MGMRFHIAMVMLTILMGRMECLHAQQQYTEYWFSFGCNYKPDPSDTVVYGTGSRYEIHISSLHHASGMICFTSTRDTVHFSVRPGHAYSHPLDRNQILACYHQIPRDLGKVTDMSVCVTSDSAVSVSVISQQTHSSDATQLLPVEAWGTEYRMIMQSGRYSSAGGTKTQELLLLANRDGTVVQMNGNPLCTLNRGEILFRRFNENLTGCRFHSNHPIAVFDIQMLGYVPIDGSADKALEQYYPQSTWGRDFFVPVTCMDREFVQVMATENNTDIRQYGGTLRTNINGVGKLSGLRAGEWVWIEVFQENNGCYIHANRPVVVNSFMPTYNYYHHNGYSDPSVVWISAAAQRVRQGLVKAYEIPQGTTVHDTLSALYYALVVIPTYGKDSTLVSVNGRNPQPLSGGQWRDHPSGWSYYNMPIFFDTLTYTISNHCCGLQLYHYGVSTAESYHEQASCMYRNLKIAFYGNDTHYLSLPDLRLCEQEVVFRGEVHDSLMDGPGHIRWYIDSVEEVAARDSLVWRKYFKRGVYHLRMEVCYEDGFTTQSIESELHVVSLEVQAVSTPEYCHRSDGSIAIVAHSDAPATLSYLMDSVVCADSVGGLHAGWYHLRVQDAYCTVERHVRVDSVEGPVADFVVTPEMANVGMVVTFTDQSVSKDDTIWQWQWFLADGSQSAERHPMHIYSKVMEDSVMLVVTDGNGCKDTAFRPLRIVDKLEFPNAFAPVGSDGQPRYFTPMEEKGCYRSFEMIIYNRWGNRVWRQHCAGGSCPDYADEAFWWDGRDMRGTPVSAGVYFWVAKATFDSGLPPLTLQGSVTVFR